MTADEVCIAALARCAEFNARVPSTRSVMWHRISARQQQLFSHIADVEPEYFGRSATITLASNQYDLGTLNPKAERVTYVEIANAGTSAYATNDRVNVVPIMDVAAALQPRATIRDFILKGVEIAGVNDLTNVTSLQVHYSKRANVVDGAADTIELPEQFQELLVIDLAKHLLRKALELGDSMRESVIKLLDIEEAEMMADLDRHLEHWRYAETSRFDHSQAAQARPVT